MVPTQEAAVSSARAARGLSIETVPSGSTTLPPPWLATHSSASQVSPS